MGASVTVTAGTGSISVPPTRPPSTATVDEILEYVNRLREVEAKRVQHEVDRLHDRTNKLRDRVKRNELPNEERFAAHDQRITLALGGRAGRGLDTTWLGLVIAAVGLAAQGAAVWLTA